MRHEKLTRARVLQLGLAVLALGGFGYWAFLLLGFEDFSAGIASEAFLVALLIFWTGSYVLRVIRGKMTFMEQRRRYIKEFEELTTSELQARFEAMSQEEQIKLLEEIEIEKNAS